ncbi:hypothetical protein [Jiella sonneratiae]|uniref:Uncharacterized protein n=1 Tax=Jiella sonneratiae TaxID=2816856 RepID=A0ABS3J6B5_9HYPH|nr:hypothetical protein [Jiella sonneratiae]MBO0904690.1 hypothetical protein [Jiella sonneratiae]
MFTRLTILTIVIALFGLGMSYLAQRGGSHAKGGNFVASLSGGSCDYTSGTVCRINRGGAGTNGLEAKF